MRFRLPFTCYPFSSKNHQRMLYRISAPSNPLQTNLLTEFFTVSEFHSTPSNFWYAADILQPSLSWFEVIGQEQFKFKVLDLKDQKISLNFQVAVKVLWFFGTSFIFLNPLFRYIFAFEELALCFITWKFHHFEV